MRRIFLLIILISFTVCLSGQDFIQRMDFPFYYAENGSYGVFGRYFPSGNIHYNNVFVSNGIIYDNNIYNDYSLNNFNIDYLSSIDIEDNFIYTCPKTYDDSLTIVDIKHLSGSFFSKKYHFSLSHYAFGKNHLLFNYSLDDSDGEISPFEQDFYNIRLDIPIASLWSIGGGLRKTDYNSQFFSAYNYIADETTSDVYIRLTQGNHILDIKGYKSDLKRVHAGTNDTRNRYESKGVSLEWKMDKDRFKVSSILQYSETDCLWDSLATDGSGGFTKAGGNTYNPLFSLSNFEYTGSAFELKSTMYFKYIEEGLYHDIMLDGRYNMSDCFTITAGAKTARYFRASHEPDITGLSGGVEYDYGQIRLGLNYQYQALSNMEDYGRIMNNISDIIIDENTRQLITFDGSYNTQLSDYRIRMGNRLVYCMNSEDVSYNPELFNKATFGIKKDFFEGDLVVGIELENIASSGMIDYYSSGTYLIAKYPYNQINTRITITLDDLFTGILAAENILSQRLDYSSRERRNGAFLYFGIEWRFIN